MVKEPKINSEKSLRTHLKKFKDLSKNPEQFLSLQSKKVEKFKEFLKLIYDYSYEKDDSRTSDILPNLVIEDMDEEQIWQQLELKNNAIWQSYLKDTSKLLVMDNESLNLTIQSPEDEQQMADDSASETDEEQNEDAPEKYDEFFDESENESNIESDVSIKESKTKSKVKPNKIKIIPSVLDDKFFKLSELEAYLDLEDKKEMQKMNTKSGFQKPDDEGEEIDYFADTDNETGDDDDDDDDNDKANVNYIDFFDPDSDTEKTQETENKPGKKSKKKQEEVDAENNLGSDEEAEENSEEGADDDIHLNGNDKDFVQDSQSDDDNFEDNDNTEDKPKSSHEERQARLRERIDEYEEKALGEKPWQLKGEISAASRPHNSVLEEILEFDSSTRPAPVITEEVNMSIESIICQRIKDKAWDDVVKTVRPIQSAQEFRKTLILDQEKSKLSLAQIYEKDYQKEIEKINPQASAESEEEPKTHREIKQLMAALFSKLDALSNFHFTPKPVMPEPKIITNTPAVSMEEVAPLIMSEARLLAPEEVKKRTKGDVIGSTERTKTDKNRDRRNKKSRQKAVFKAKEIHDLAKQKAGIPLSSKEEKDKMFRAVIKNRNVSKINESTNGKAFKSSKAFFTQMQDKTTSRNQQGKRKTDNQLLHTNSLNAKKLKL